MALDTERAYLKVLKALRDLIAADFAEGGWLPPGRAMSEQLGVNPLTYRKAVACLVSEGMAIAFPGKGHLVQPRARRPRKVGVVLGNAGECPYLARGQTLEPVFRRLGADGFDCQLIQSSPVAKLADKALIYCVEGLLWLSPPPSALPVVLDIAAKGGPPLVMVSFYTEDVPPRPGLNVVTRDYEGTARARADFLWGRGHRRIVYVTGNALQQKHFSDAWLGLGGALAGDGRLYDMTRRPEQLDGSLDGVTGLVAECGGLWMENIFKALSALPPERQPECLFPATGDLPEHRRRFPMVNVVAADTNDMGLLAAAAAGMMADHLRRGAPLAALKVADYSRTVFHDAPESPARQR